MKVLIGLMGLMVLIEGTWLFQNKPLDQSIADGKEIYQDFCLQCHLDTGKGVSGVFPPLAQSDYLLNDIFAMYLICCVLFGINCCLIFIIAEMDSIGCKCKCNYGNVKAYNSLEKDLNCDLELDNASV